MAAPGWGRRLGHGIAEDCGVPCRRRSEDAQRATDSLPQLIPTTQRLAMIGVGLSYLGVGNAGTWRP